MRSTLLAFLPFAMLILAAPTSSPGFTPTATPLAAKKCYPAHKVDWPNPETNCSFTCVASPSCTAGAGADVIVKGECKDTGPACQFPCGTKTFQKTTYQCVVTPLGCPETKKRCVWNPIGNWPVVVEDCCVP